MDSNSTSTSPTAPATEFPPLDLANQELGRYFPTVENDLLLTNLWARLRADETMFNLARTYDMPLSEFYKMFTPDKAVILGVAEGIGIWFAAWFEPFLDGAFYSLFVTPEARYTKQAMNAVLLTLDFGLTGYGKLLVVTGQKRLLDTYQRLGYTICGCLPGMYGGYDAHIALLTREGFDNRPLKRSP